jgi:L-fuculose-phosphate aldolase
MLMKTELDNIKKEVVEAYNYLLKNKLITGFDGNISVRIGDNRILITPQGKQKINLTQEHLVVIDLYGNKLDGVTQPSGEWRIHTVVYQNRDDINAVVHTHPVYSTVVGICGFNINKPLLAETLVYFEGIAQVEYATFYTEELAKKLKKYLSHNDVFILKNHGLVTIAEDLQTAVIKTEKFEYLSKIFCLTKILGKQRFLTKTQVKEIKEVLKNLPNN